MDTDTPFEYELVGGRQRIIKRPRLTRLLDDSKARILLMVAPAGYGKTTLMRQWLAEKERRSCWYTGGPASADVAALCVQLADAVQNVAPGAGRRLRERLSVTDSPESEVQVLAELLAEDLVEWPPDAWLAFDDYQFATERPAAETFVALLLQLAPIRLILTTRRRPAWATARRVLYGEIFELTQSELSMTDPEATAILESTRAGESIEELLERACGWPAVIGLAALADSDPLPPGELPPTLFDYFAHEMYRTLGSQLRDALLILAMAAKIDPDVCRHLFGSDAQTVSEQVVQVGFVTRTSARELSLHPLLREFLQLKLNDEPSPKLERSTRALGLYYLETNRWDDAFVLATRMRNVASLEALLEQALEALLSAGRVATLEQWLGYAEQHAIEGPLVQLAQAQVDLRSGLSDRAEILALKASESLRANSNLLATALVVAAQSAHFGDRPRIALDRLQRARGIATSPRLLEDIYWLIFCVAVDIDVSLAARTFDEFTAIDDHSPEHVLRAANGHLMLSVHDGHLDDVVDHSYSLLDFCSRTRDPKVRTGYLHGLATGLVQTGRYRQAAEVSALCIDESKNSKLTFVLPHAFLHCSDAAFGLRRFREAHEMLNRSRTSIGKTRNVHVEVNSAIALIRLLLAEGATDEAVRHAQSQQVSSAAEVTIAEFEATHALALTCVDQLDEALVLGDLADRRTESMQVRTLTAFVRAIVALRLGASTSEMIGKAVQTLSEAGHVHCFVVAYRAHPPVLLASAQYLPISDLSGIIDRAHDRTLARKVGLRMARPNRDETALLTSREREVFELLSQGRSNRQIARALFISETTTKVHVRHIFEKLDVKSRTQAASRAAEILD